MWGTERRERVAAGRTAWLREGPEKEGVHVRSAMLDVNPASGVHSSMKTNVPSWCRANTPCHEGGREGLAQ